MTDSALASPAEQKAKLSVFGVVGTTLRTFAATPFVYLGFALIYEAPSIVVLLASPNLTPGKFNSLGIGVGVGKMLILFLLQTAMTFIAVRRIEGEPAGTGEAMALALRRYLPMLGASVLAILATYLGMILLVVPGLILACMYVLVVPVCALETLGPITSLKRSAALTKTMRWRIAGVYAIVLGVVLLISTPVTFLLTLRGHALLGQWIGVGLGLLWVPITTIFPAVLYLDLRRLKDNMGLARIFD